MPTHPGATDDAQGEIADACSCRLVRLTPTLIELDDSVARLLDREVMLVVSGKSICIDQQGWPRGPCTAGDPVIMLLSVRRVNRQGVMNCKVHTFPGTDQGWGH